MMNHLILNSVLFVILSISTLFPVADGLNITPKGPVREGEINGVEVQIVELNAEIDGDLNKEIIIVNILEKELEFVGKLVERKSWYGEIDNGFGGTANFHLSDDNRLTGSVTLGDYICHVSSKVDGKVLAECIKQSDFQIELDPPDIPTSSGSGRADIDDGGEEFQYHDIMVVYTLRAMCAEAGLAFPCEITEENKAPIESRVALAFQETNDAYSMSAVMKGTVRLVHTYLNSEYEEVDEDDEFEASSNYQQMLNDLTDRGDGKLTEVHALRERHGADIVNLWVDTGGACGLAWGACTNEICDGDYAFSVQQRSCTTGYYTFGHENGHISGCQHDRANDPDIRLFAYGWQDPQQRFRTIMAYDCDDQTCGKVQRFSTPDVTIGDGEAIGDDKNDNSRQIDLTWEEVASFMPSGGTGGSIKIYSAMNEKLCMSASGKGKDSNVKLRDSKDCTSFRISDDGLIRVEGKDLCLQAGYGKSLKDGSKMRFFPCDSSNKFQQFSWKQDGEANPIKLKSKAYGDLCVASRGVRAEKQDPIIFQDCAKLRPTKRREWFGA